MARTLLSYTAINNYLISPHSYINKQLHIQTPTTPAMDSGKAAHKIIQDHCLGKTKDSRIKDFTWNFTTAEQHVTKPYDKNYNLHGYLDLVNYKSKMFAEIKTGGTLWSQSRFHESMQPKYYADILGFRKVLFITCHFDLSDFKTYYAEISDDDIEKSKVWVKKAIDGIEEGNFYSDLTPEKLCIRPDCVYGDACWFRTKHE